MKRMKLVGAGFLLIILSMFFLSCDFPVTGITYVTGIILLFIGGFSWARKLHWSFALTIGGMLFAAAYLAGVYIYLIVKDQVVGDERNDFLAHLIGSVLFWPGIVFIMAGVASVYRSLQSWLEKQKIKKRNRVRLCF